MAGDIRDGGSSGVGGPGSPGGSGAPQQSQSESTGPAGDGGSQSQSSQSQTGATPPHGGTGGNLGNVQSGTSPSGTTPAQRNPDGSVSTQPSQTSPTSPSTGVGPTPAPKPTTPVSPSKKEPVKPKPKPRPPAVPTHSWKAKKGHPCHIETTTEKCNLLVEVDAPVDDTNALGRFEVEVTAVNPSSGPKTSSERRTLSPDRDVFVFRDLDAGWYMVTLFANEGAGKAQVATQHVEVVPTPTGRAPHDEPLRFVAHDPPNLGQIHMQLFDALGNNALASRSYSISGEKALKGTTDARGVLRHRRVPAGLYKLTIDGAQEEAVAIVLSPFDPVPQTRFLA